MCACMRACVRVCVRERGRETGGKSSVTKQHKYEGHICVTGRERRARHF